MTYADLSLTNPRLVGDTLDIEMYGAAADGSSAGPVNSNACFCDDCFSRYLTNRGLSANVAPADRYRWLADRFRLGDYYRYLELRLTTITANVASQVYARNPNFVLGYLNFDDSWFSRGLVRGFGTGGHPVFVLPQQPTYRHGWGPWVGWTTNRYQALNAMNGTANIVFVPGLWLGMFTPTALTSEMESCSKASDGYWLFSTASFYSENPGPSQTGNIGLSLQGPVADYWAAVREANEDIQPSSTTALSTSGLHLQFAEPMKILKETNQ